MVCKNIPLIIGPLPPPIGGVAVHVQRLISELNKQNYNFSFINSKELKFSILFRSLFIHKTIHLHSSNVYFQFFVSIFSFLFRKKLIITFHRDIFRYEHFHRILFLLNIILCDTPIVLNEKSYAFSLKFNSNTKYISSFIPPDLETEMSLNKVPNFFNSRFEKYFCTNAFDFVFDSKGQEIYQITTLVDIFKNFPSYLLVISDPSGSYTNAIAKSLPQIPDNIIFIPYPHSFFQILKQSDCLIRFTTTDGDSLSVREALYLNKFVIATNVVNRPIGVTTVNLNKNDLTSLIKSINFSIGLKSQEMIPTTTLDLINLYN